MDQRPLSQFPTETDPAVVRPRAPAAAALPRQDTPSRLPPSIDSFHALEQNVQFLKARSHAHALSERDRSALEVTADAPTPVSDGRAGRSAPHRIPAAAVIAVAIVTALAATRLLPTADRTQEQPAESLITLMSRTLDAPAPQPVVAELTPSPELRIQNAEATSERVFPDAASRLQADPTPYSPVPGAATATGIPTGAPAPKVTFKGQLVVESVPSGATVLINQTPAGETPLNLTDYPAGSYAVWLEREGYERWTAGVRVQAGKTTHIRPMLSSRPDREAIEK